MYMKNTYEKISNLNDRMADLYEQLEELRTQRNEIAEARIDELEQLIREATEHGNRPLNAHQLSSLTEGEFSWQSISQLGVHSEKSKSRFYDEDATMPSLARQCKHTMHHYVELDDDGKVIDTLDIDKCCYEYWVR